MNPIMDGNIISPSSPSSSSSSNASSSPVMIRGEGLPPYGSNPMCASSRLPSDNELRYEGIEKLIQRLHNCESDRKKLLMERGRVMKDVNRRLQVHLVEVRGLKDLNQKLQQEKDRLVIEKERLIVEKDELASMCCFLDDDRDKAKKMAREWQVFGRYATGVLQKELSQCNTKIRDLEQRQQTLLAENKNLKELCLLLDQEQAGSRTSLDSQSSLHGPVPGLLGVAGTRDSGDGSSNGSTASNSSPDHRLSSNPLQKDNNSGEGREGYVRYLEHKVRHLEDEVKGRLKKVTSTVPTHPQGIFNMSPVKPPPVDRRTFPSSMQHHHSSSNSSPASSVLSHNLSNSSSSVNNAPIGSTITSPVGRLSGSDTSINKAQTQTPEAIAYAMKQVLELHDQLDNSLPNSMYPVAPGDGNHLDKQHKEIVREMCNVVWRKLGDSRSGNTKPPPQGRTLQHRTASVSNL